MLRVRESRTRHILESQAEPHQHAINQDHTSDTDGGTVDQVEEALMEKSRDQDQGKGAVEQDQDNEGGNTSMNGQLGHRDENAELKNADSDLSG